MWKRITGLQRKSLPCKFLKGNLVQLQLQLTRGTYRTFSIISSLFLEKSTSEIAGIALS
jgi:hypothetical protein